MTTYEYLWIGGDLIIRQNSGGKMIVKCSIPGDRIVGIWHLGEKIPMENRGLLSRNYCATIPGILMRRSTLFYRVNDGQMEKLVFEPSEELRKIVKKSIGEKTLA